MYGCAVPLIVAELVAEFGEALVEDVAPEVVTFKAVMASLPPVSAYADTLVLSLLGPLVRGDRVRVRLQLWRSRGLFHFPLLFILVCD